MQGDVGRERPPAGREQAAWAGGLLPLLIPAPHPPYQALPVDAQQLRVASEGQPIVRALGAGAPQLAPAGGAPHHQLLVLVSAVRGQQAACWSEGGGSIRAAAARAFLRAAASCLPRSPPSALPRLMHRPALLLQAWASAVREGSALRLRRLELTAGGPGEAGDAKVVLRTRQILCRRRLAGGVAQLPEPEGGLGAALAGRQPAGAVGRGGQRVDGLAGAACGLEGQRGRATAGQQVNRRPRGHSQPACGAEGDQAGDGA